LRHSYPSTPPPPPLPAVLSLILARAVQGIGAALLVPGCLAIISASFSAQQRGRSIGTWSGFSALTTVVGPMLGGTPNA
jgi:MFS family permease